jgi:hypothetical protein
LAAALLIYERASYLAWRLWVVVILVIGVMWLASLAAHWRANLPVALFEEREAARKGKWLQWGNRKRKA